MAYSGDPAASEIDAVRFWLGDTSATDPLLNDAELRYVNDLYQDYSGGDARLLAAAACDYLMAKYAGQMTISADGVSYSPGELTDKYTALAKQLREAYARGTGPGAPTARTADVPLFSLGMYDNPEGLSQFGSADEDRWDPSNYQVG